jgi:hypothetical protein
MLQRIKDKLEKIETALVQQKKIPKAAVDGAGEWILSLGTSAAVAAGIAGFLAPPLAVLAGLFFAAAGTASLHIAAKMPLPEKTRQPPSSVGDSVIPVLAMGAAFGTGVALAVWPLIAFPALAVFAAATAGSVFYRRRYSPPVLKNDPVPPVAPVPVPEVPPQPPKLEAGVSKKFEKAATEKPAEPVAEKPAEPKPPEPPKL